VFGLRGEEIAAEKVKLAMRKHHQLRAGGRSEEIVDDTIESLDTREMDLSAGKDGHEDFERLLREG
jgi:hypothetical protein